MLKMRKKIIRLENFQSIQDFLPKDHSNRHSPVDYIKQLDAHFTDSYNVLDLGCGEGNSIEIFERLAPRAIWQGVDIENSPEVRKRTRKNKSIKTFDGVNLPYANNSFDLIFCNQVLEHVRFPDKLISESFRILKSGGLFIGAVSYLEPYHSYSIFNFTPYGLARVITDSGLQLDEIRPGVDASVLINRQLLSASSSLSLLWKRNYLHNLIDLLSRLSDLGHCETNFLKIQFSGHLVFLARRPFI